MVVALSFVLKYSLHYLCSLLSLQQEQRIKQTRTETTEEITTTTTTMCLPTLHRKMDASSLVVAVAVMNDITETGTREHEHVGPTEDAENTNTDGTPFANDTALTLTLLPTETTLTSDSLETVLELRSYSPDTVMMTIATLFESLPTMPARDMDALLAAGLCHALAQAMNQHGDVLELQGQACFLLANLAFQSDDIAARIIHSGGDVAIVNGMKRFPLVAEFQHLACVTLNNLIVTTNEDSGRYESVVAAGGIPTLIATMYNFPFDTKIGMFACFCLLKLTDSSLDNCRLAMEHGAIEAVAGVISASQDANNESLEGLAVVLIMRFLDQKEKEMDSLHSPSPRAAAHSANE
jgi:hypothetical protein